MPDEKEGYVLGEIKATKGDIVSVAVPGGEVCITVQIEHSFFRLNIFYVQWEKSDWNLFFWC